MFGSKLHQNDPKAIISNDQIAEIHKKLKSIKYPVNAISNAMYAIKKLNQFNSTIKK